MKVIVVVALAVGFYLAFCGLIAACIGFGMGTRPRKRRP